MPNAPRAARRLLLLSNSRDPAGRYLVHARDALAPLGIAVRGLHAAADPAAALARAEAVLVGEHPAVVFRAGRDAEELPVGASLAA